MDGQAALAFVARRAGERSMDPARWSHVMSLELGWMPPAEAKRYVHACVEAGLLEADGDALRLTFDPKGVEVPRGFRPDPSRLPEAAPGAGREDASGTRREAASEAGPEPDGEPDLFAAWLPKVAAARAEDLGETMAAVERMQEQAGGLLHAEAAILALGAAAGLDVKQTAVDALTALRV